jgi:hypothetical protein
MNSTQFLDAVRARHSIPSDRKLSVFLAIDQPRVSAVRNGRRRLDPDMCMAVAKALDLPPEHVFASVAAERAKHTEHRRVWERLAKMAKSAGAAIVLGFAATSPQPTHASTQSADATSVYYGKRRTWMARGRDRRRSDRRRRRAALPLSA